MKKHAIMPVLVFSICYACLAILGQAAVVNLTLFNTVPLLDRDGVPLKGNSTSGDLVELIYAGPDQAIDLPNVFGAPDGDDSIAPFLFNIPTFVGAGRPNTSDDGFVEQALISYDEAWIGFDVYVRFWDAENANNALWYGDSSIFTLPAGDMFNFASLDFVPNALNNFQTNVSWTAVPEPSTSLFLFCGIFVFFIRKQFKTWERQGVVWLCLSFLSFLPMLSFAQFEPPFDVSSSRPIQCFDGEALIGNNSQRNTLGLSVVPGALVQIISVGVDGKASYPSPTGAVQDDDVLLYSLRIGEGMSPGLASSGRLSVTRFDPPAAGTRLYARAFNGATLASSTHWGQSSIFTYELLSVMDLSQIGLDQVSVPLGSDLSDDSDNDGVSNLEELVANTNASDSDQVFRAAWSDDLNGLSIATQAGRAYRIYRCANLNHLPLKWEVVHETAVFTEPEDFVFEWLVTSSEERGVFKVEVLLPDELF